MNDGGAVRGRLVLLGGVHGFLVILLDQELESLSEQSKVAVLVSHFRGIANLVVNVLDVRCGQDDVPVPMPMASPGVKKVHGAISFFGGIHATREIEALKKLVVPLFWEKGLRFVENQEGVSGCPLEPSTYTFHAFHCLVVDGFEFKAIGQIGEHCTKTVFGKAADVGDDGPALLCSWYGIVPNSAGGFVGAVRAVVNFDSHGYRPTKGTNLRAQRVGIAEKIRERPWGTLKKDSVPRMSEGIME